jgi:hypothetical protein
MNTHFCLVILQFFFLCPLNQKNFNALALNDRSSYTEKISNSIGSTPSKNSHISARIMAESELKNSTSNFPSSQPTVHFVAPSPPEDIVTAFPTVTSSATATLSTTESTTISATISTTESATRYATESTYKTPYPSSLPTSHFVAPSKPEDEVTAVPTASVSTNGSEIIDTNKATTTISPTFSPSLQPTVKMDKEPVPIDDTNIGGAQNIEKEIIEENATALNSAKYVFITFLGCIFLFGIVHTVKR